MPLRPPRALCEIQTIPLLRRQLEKTRQLFIPGGPLGTRFDNRRWVGFGDNPAAGSQIGNGADGQGLDKHIPQGRRFYRPGHHRQIAGIGGKAIEQLILATATHNSHRIDAVATQLAEGVEHGAITQRQTFETTAYNCPRGGGHGNPVALTITLDSAGHIVGIEEVVGIGIDDTGKCWCPTRERH